MSSSTYTLKIDIDDTKIREIEKRLMAIVGGKQGGAGGLGTTIQQASSGGSMGKNIAKLGMIAAGVAGILMAVKKIAELTIASSPMLMQMLKLINFGVMLILRPIGDFFGFFLRPLVIYFLRSIILPWYRIARPIMQKFGQWLGNAVTQNVSSNISGAWALLTGDWDTVARLNAEGNAKMQLAWDNAMAGMNDWINSLNLPSWDIFNTGILTWALGEIEKLPAFGLGIYIYFRTWILGQIPKLPSWGDIINTNFVQWIINGIPKLPSWGDINIAWGNWLSEGILTLPTWEDVTAAINGIGDGILSVIATIMELITNIAAAFGIDIGGNKNTSTSTSPAPAPTGGLGEYIQGGLDNIFNWLTETPAGATAWEQRGR